MQNLTKMGSFDAPLAAPPTNRGASPADHPAAPAGHTRPPAGHTAPPASRGQPRFAGLRMEEEDRQQRFGQEEDAP